MLKINYNPFRLVLLPVLIFNIIILFSSFSNNKTEVNPAFDRTYKSQMQNDNAKIAAADIIDCSVLAGNPAAGWIVGSVAGGAYGIITGVNRCMKGQYVCIIGPRI